MKYNPSLHKLSNGISVIFDPMDLETTSVRIRFNTGSRDEKPSQYGITHFCEHMFCKGTPRFPNRDAMRKFAWLNDMGFSASTGNSVLNFYGNCLPNKLTVLIDFLSDILSDSLFDSESIEQERGVILDERNRFLDQEKTKYDDLVDRELFGNKNVVYCGKTIGTPENIKSFTREQMLKFISKRMSSTNCTIIVSGRIENQKQVLETLEQKFHFLKPFDVPENTDIKYTPSQAHLSIPDRNSTTVNILFSQLYPMDKNYQFQRLCADMWRYFVEMQLNKCLRQENSLVYGIQNVDVLDDNNKFLLNGIQTKIAPKNIEQCVALIAKTCADIYYNNTMTQEDLDLLNARIRMMDARFLDSRADRERKLLDYYYCNKELYCFSEDKKLKNAITLQDIIKYTRGMFNDKTMSILTMGADYNCDLIEIWRKNFRPNNNNILLKSKNTRNL